MNNNLFRKKSIDKATAPEHLDQYVKVVSPGVVFLISAVLLLLVSLFIWAITGNIYSSVQANASVLNSEIICYVSPDDAARISEGMQVHIGDEESVVTGVSGTPLTPQDVEKELNDAYVADAVVVGEWNVKVEIAPVDIEDGPTVLSITTEKINPIEFLINS